MTTLDSKLYFARKWQLWRNAKMFPRLVAKCDYILTFTLGRDDFGYEYGRHDLRYTGPKLDLTGTMVRLHVEKLPYKPSYPDEARGENWYFGSDVFTVTGTVTDASGGVVEFSLSTSNTNVVGDCIGEVEVTDASDNIIVPGHVRFHFLEKLR